MFLLNGKTYYCDIARISGWVRWNEQLLHFDENGVLDQKETGLSGWITKDGKTYYFTKESQYMDMVQTVDGAMYGFDWDNGLVTNASVVGYNYRQPNTQLDYDGWYSRTIWVDAQYFCGADGKIQKGKGWKTGADGSKYYTDSNGRCYVGFRIIDGKTYLFDRFGRMVS